ncbi:hypothetical protein A2331_05565 [Candidatus Falkowbacteria bacterium RIFOXYB2_FULL_34_18]|uniref:DUF3006 domain-containing protein n=1 Tax=Candidatus Falkowbacteria bacterium RIFOXYD2_FULL_34_120 TaxID=1798007 RepID=A0A1F5TR77_9BACT|nr:MAG: hypothetical protein A2331_05565 [Candidatus Falkowbacteria bacterium RIFOXYB2_FULL_34_18]OGF29824.1 MAG: hypothetical protein A2500_01465 [Candidatus Falkowbacteria bacterium RIFOXYC12_FULL_34_55]OGF37061.1 MAG: hypothetical protein A2466_05740 [Candidatus Falkowbacteria bacterium RIFOXYC2_FULL_34_220]OGF39253.1 MAG: hypothetical protein A2515_00950 [Candidatus Falkowbacteria bacterium RIFOXYD12_FULL_34_57]OGF41358.1 MAG: hypothetical protein A2531_07160 [Candidatus Falkowbacteria bact
MNIELIIDKFEGESAILKTKDNKTINWPKEKLPKDAKEQMKLNFYISEKNIEQETAKNILNEILNHDT